MRPHDTRRELSARLTACVLVAITLLALGLRWPAVHRLLPHRPEPDAFLVLHAQLLRHDPALPQHLDFAERYPTLLTRVLAALPLAHVDAGAPRNESTSGNESTAGNELVTQSLAAAAQPYVQGRALVLLLSMLLVPLAYAVARRFLRRGPSIVAAFLVATSLLHALFSTQARPHGAHASLALLAVWAALRAVEKTSLARLAIAALCASLAIACLQSGLFTLPPLALALWFSGGSKPARIAKAALVPLAAACAAWWAYPVLPHVDASGVHLGGSGSHDFFFSQFTLRGFAVSSHWLLGHDPAMLALGSIGALLSIVWLARHARALLREEHRALLVALSYALPYSALLIVSEEVYDRFLLPLLPWIAIVSAWAWTWLLDVSLRTRLARPMILALLFTALALPLAALVQFARVSLAPDTLEQAAAWIEAHDDPARGDRILASSHLALPVLCDGPALDAGVGDNGAESSAWIAWQTAHRPPPAARAHHILMFPARVANVRSDADLQEIDRWLATFAPEWAVIEVSPKMSTLAGPRRLRAWLQDHGDLAYAPRGEPRSGPLDDGEAMLIDYQSVEDLARRLFSATAFGPPIEIYRMRH